MDKEHLDIFAVYPFVAIDPNIQNSLGFKVGDLVKVEFEDELEGKKSGFYRVVDGEGVKLGYPTKIPRGFKVKIKGKKGGEYRGPTKYVGEGRWESWLAEQKGDFVLAIPRFAKGKRAYGEVIGVDIDGHFRVRKILGDEFFEDLDDAPEDVQDKIAPKREGLYIPSWALEKFKVVPKEAVVTYPFKKKKIDMAICCTIVNGQYQGVMEVIDSARCYIDGTYVVVIANLSNDDTVERLRKEVEFGDVKIFDATSHFKKLLKLQAGNKMNAAGIDMYFSFSQAFIYALNHYEFKYMMKMDTDALIIGPGLINYLDDYFNKRPDVGMIGCLSTKCNLDDRVKSTNYWGGLMVTEDEFWGKFTRTIKKNDPNYIIGENVMGGTYIIRYDCLKKMYKKRLLNNDALLNQSVHEDTIFSTFARYVGYKLGRVCGKGEPFGMAWVGLPADIQSLVKGSKLVAHSIKFDETDQKIRKYLADRRRKHRIWKQ